MTLKTAKLFLIGCIILFIGIAVWIGLRNLSYFDIGTIDVQCSGPVFEVSDDMYRCISPYKGINLFKARLDFLQHSLMNFEGVESVVVEKYFPDRLIVKIGYAPYKARISFEEDMQKYYFLTQGDRLEEVSEETFRLFSALAEIQLNPSYAYLILRWGTDNGFNQMCNLAEELGRKNLNTVNKYDNNNSNDFGLLTVESDNPKAVLCIREPVTPQRLSDAWDMIMRESGTDEEKSRYDLYSTALVKRRNGGVNGF